MSLTKTETYIRPRLMPRTPADGIIAIGVGLFLLALVCGLPAYIVGEVTDSDALSFAAFGVLLLAYTSIVISKLAVDDSGIRFVRLFGSPKVLSWAEIVSIKPVERRSEVIMRGWLWPLFPPREATASWTSLGHYRIVWSGGDCYFPPANAQEFEALVAARVGVRPVPDLVI